MSENLYKRKIMRQLMFFICLAAGISAGSKDIEAAVICDAVRLSENTDQSEINSGWADSLQDQLTDIDYQELEEAMEEALGTDELSFQDLAEGLANGEYSLNLDFIKELLLKGAFGNLNSAKSLLTQILVLSILSAMFSMISSVFGNGQISEIAFYVVYLLLMTLLINTFRQASEIASDTVEKVLNFVKVMMPVYVLVVAAAGGQTTAVVFYEFFLFLVFAVQWLVARFLLPLIRIYVILGVVNHISKEDLFSKMAEFVKMVIQWSLKTLVGIVIGFQVLQGLISPYIDSFRTAAFHKTLMSIPGVGTAIDSVTEMAVGAVILIKNGMGVAAMIVLVLVCLAPTVTLAVYVFLYQLTRALIQPVADKRIVKSLGYVKEGTHLLMRTVFISCFLFLLTIAVLTSCT